MHSTKCSCMFRTKATVKWKLGEQFNKEDTREMPFKVTKNEEKPVQMMCKKFTVNMTYIGEIFTKILLLPYVGNELNMIIMLPDEHVELRMVEKEITYEKFIEWTRLDKMDEEEVEVFLPRFKLEENYEMKEFLCKLGMTDAFEGRADFSGISSKQGLCLSKVVHKSFVEVNEEGTEAAAATAAIMMMRLCIMNSLSEENGAFAINLLNMFCQNNPSGNVCYSPMSISSALAMVLLGAKGDTATEMFQLSCLKCYHSELEQLSFVKAAEESRKHINTWVSKQTEGEIPELLSGGSVDSETKLVLVNALYFKGRWQTEFDKEHTREMPFRINQREERPVQMMYKEGLFKLTYVDEVQAEFLVMHYEKTELSLIVLLPVHGVDLSKDSVPQAPTSNPTDMLMQVAIYNVVDYEVLHRNPPEVLKE
ncbi:hypothetical protein STEG23_001170 [Scotinomys teguina]